MRKLTFHYTRARLAAYKKRKEQGLPVCTRVQHAEILLTINKLYCPRCKRKISTDEL